MRIYFKQTAPKEGYFGDCTARYDVSLDGEYTLREFVDEVITNRSGEWGRIEVPERCKNDGAYTILRIEYRWGKLLSKFPDNILDRKIKSIKGSGGWSAMDYSVKLKK